MENQMKQKIAIVGYGNVGQALTDGLRRAGHEVRVGQKNAEEPLRDIAAWADVTILATPWTAYAEIAKEVGEALDGKLVVDVSNVLDDSWELALGHTTSGAEQLQERLPRAHVVKAFNTQFADHMRTGHVAGERLTTFVAGDDDSARARVATLARDIGFHAVEVGPLKSARYLEPLGVLNIKLGYNLQMGPQIGLRLVTP